MPCQFVNIISDVNHENEYSNANQLNMNIKIESIHFLQETALNVVSK